MRSISVVIPAYNCQDYLAESVQSCLDQTAPVHEMIIVDDASTDGTLAAARALAEAHPTVRVIAAPKGGISRTRNRGIEEATGEFIAFLDADDVYLPHTMATYQNALAADPELEVLFGDYLQSDAPDTAQSGQASLGGIGAILAGYGDLRGDHMLLNDRFGPDYRAWRVPNAIVITNTILIARRVLDRCGLFLPELKTAEDTDLWGRAFTAGRTAALLGPPLSIYYRWRGSIEKYVQSHHERIDTLRGGLQGLSVGSAGWRAQRRQIARAYLDLIYFTGVARADRGMLLGSLFASIAAYPIPVVQLRYLATLLLPRPLVRSLIKRRNRRLAAG